MNTPETPKPGNDTGLPDPIEVLEQCARELHMSRVYLAGATASEIMPPTIAEQEAAAVVAKHRREIEQ